MSERTGSEESGDGGGGESSGTTEASTEEAPPADGDGDDAVVTSITENDVLLGRGAPAIYNTGNVRFRALAQKRRDSYNNAPRRSEKDKIARELMQEVAKRGGRFLRKIESAEEGGDASLGEGFKAWKVADQTVIADKIKQTLRCKELSPGDPAKVPGIGPKRGRDSDSFAGLALSEQLGPAGMAILRGQMPIQSEQYPAQATDDAFTLLLKRQEEERLALLQRQQEEQRAHLLAARAKKHQPGAGTSLNQMRPQPSLVRFTGSDTGHAATRNNSMEAVQSTLWPGLAPSPPRQQVHQSPGTRLTGNKIGTAIGNSGGHPALLLQQQLQMIQQQQDASASDLKATTTEFQKNKKQRH